MLLFFVALIWIIFATFQDIKKREVANWLNFSLVSFALAYRLFYSVINEDYMFFVYGLVGWGLFVVLGYAFYYGRVFAGGDSKLLMAIGAVLPFESFYDLFYVSIGFLFLLFLVGTVYSVIYSIFISIKQRKRFAKQWNIKIKNSKIVFAIMGILVIASAFVFIDDLFILFISIFGIVFIGLLYIYLLAVDKCMISLHKPEELSEGDWLIDDVRVNGKWIRKSVHGLSLNEIRLLQKSKKSVYIKVGIPFIPVFLISFIMVLGTSILGVEFQKLVFPSLSWVF